jgi:hypothetical protein
LVKKKSAPQQCLNVCKLIVFISSPHEVVIILDETSGAEGDVSTSGAEGDTGTSGNAGIYSSVFIRKMYSRMTEIVRKKL